MLFWASVAPSGRAEGARGRPLSDQKDQTRANIIDAVFETTVLGVIAVTQAMLVIWPPRLAAKLKRILPNVEAVDIAEVIKEIRITKTPEELALWRRAYVYNDRARAFARDYLLTYGPDITDLEL